MAEENRGLDQCAHALASVGHAYSTFSHSYSGSSPTPGPEVTDVSLRPPRTERTYLAKAAVCSYRLRAPRV